MGGSISWGFLYQGQVFTSGHYIVRGYVADPLGFIWGEWFKGEGANAHGKAHMHCKNDNLAGGND